MDAFYRLEAARKLVLFLFFSALLWLFVLILEYALWMPPAVRRVVFYVVWTAQAVLALVLVVFPLVQAAGFFRRKDRTQVAREIGRSLPAVSDKLLNYLQLEQLSGTDERMLTYELQRRERELLRYDFRRVLPARRYWQYVYLLFIPLFIGAFFRLQTPLSELKNSYRRLQAYNKVFVPPAPFRPEIISPLQAVPDSAYTLRIKVTGDELPATLHMETASGHIPLQRINDTLFEWHTAWLSRPLTFRLRSGPYRFGPYRIELMALPVIDSFQVAVTRPAYLGKKTVHLRQTDLEVPEGSRLQWTLYVRHADSLMGTVARRLRPQGDTVTASLRALHDSVYVFTAINTRNGRRRSVAFNLRTVPDLAPVIKVLMRADTGMYRIRHWHMVEASDDRSVAALYLYYTGADSTRRHKLIRRYARKPQIVEQLVFPGDFGLPDTLNYTYYFEVIDNNTATGPRRARSRLFTYRPLAANAEQKHWREQQTLTQSGRHLQKFDRTNRQLQKSVRELRTRPQSSWDFRMRVADNLQRSRREKQKMLQLTQRLKTMLDKMKRENPQDPRMKELEKRLQENEKRLRNDSLEQQLQKMLSKLEKEQLLDKLEKVENQNQLEKRSMERMLELLKRFYIEQSMKKMAEQLEQLARKQDSLARTDKDNPSSQQKINRQTQDMQRRFDSLQNLNKSLKQPMAVPPLKTGFKTARMFQKQAMQQMSASPQKANKNQQRAAEQLQEMARQMQSAVSSRQGEQKKEDLEQIKVLIKRLLDISFSQEDLMKRNPADELQYAPVLLGQNRMLKALDAVADTLNAIALRQPAISEDIFDHLNGALYHGKKSLDLLQDQKFYLYKMQARSFYQDLNRLIYLLNLFLDTQNSQSMAMGQGSGQKKPQSGLPDKMKKKSNQIKQGMQEMLRQQGQKRSGGQQMSKQAWKMYKDQQQLKEMLQQFEDQYPSKRIAELNRKLDELSKKILRKGLTRKDMDEYLQIHYELLKLLHATYKQHKDDKRRSRTGRNRQAPPDSLRLEMFRRYFPQYEQLMRAGIPLEPYYEQLYKKYKKQL